MKSAEKGFTLIEIMATMAILGIALTIIIELFSSGLRLAQKSQDYSRAIFYGRQLLEEICLQKETSEKVEEGEFEGGYTWKYEITPFSTLMEEDEKNDFTLKIFKIKVFVFWLQGDKKKSIDFETLKTVITTEES